MNAMPAGIWREVVGSEGRYMVSSTGLVWSLFSGRVLTATPSVRHGYPRVNVRVEGKRRMVEIHRLVARAHLPGPTGPVVRHLDGDRMNNDVSNLAYGSVSDNALDTVRHGRNRNVNLTACSHGHPFSDENTYRRGTSRVCRTCNRASVARYAARRKAKRMSTSIDFCDHGDQCAHTPAPVSEPRDWAVIVNG